MTYEYMCPNFPLVPQSDQTNNSIYIDILNQPSISPVPHKASCSRHTYLLLLYIQLENIDREVEIEIMAGKQSGKSFRSYVLPFSSPSYPSIVHPSSIQLPSTKSMTIKTKSQPPRHPAFQADAKGQRARHRRRAKRVRSRLARDCGREGLESGDWGCVGEVSGGWG